MTDPSSTTEDAPDERQAASHLARNLASLRHTRSLAQDALAKAAAVPRSTIANLESGAGNPSLVVLVKVAAALGVPIDELLASPRAMVRRWPASEVATRQKGRGVSIRELVPEPVPDEMMEVMDFEPGAVMGGTPHLPGTREFFTCLDGRVNLMVAGTRYELAEGDVLAFPGNQPHSYQNADAQLPARGISVVVLAKAGV
jgi:quercetin dioxygenase-like cupin family protein/DNA-binding XRE family transcriptional regulator